jgi:flavodoxin
MRTSVIYNSHSGTTKALATEIGKFLAEKGIENKVGSIDSYDRDYLQSADLVMLGCWTSGLMIIAQQPDRPWKYFAKRMPPINDKPVAFFTTYKLATGSMFRRMEKTLNGKISKPVAFIRSKSRSLSDENRAVLERLAAEMT